MFCAKCNHAINLEYGQTKCPHCGAEIGPDIATRMNNTGLKPPSSEPYSQDTSTPQSSLSPLWDNNGPFFTRLFNTWKETMFHPGRFFKQTPTDGGLGKPLLYAIIIGFIAAAGGVFWNLVFTALQIPFFGMRKEDFALMPGLYEVIPYIMIGLVILSPIFITIGAFIGSGILHLSLMIVGGNKKGFEATFRSVAYGQSPQLFNLIPLCGWPVGLVWQIIITIIGLKETHRISTGKAVIAYLLPLILCCVCGFVLAMVIGIGIFSAIATPHSMLH